MVVEDMQVAAARAIERGGGGSKPAGAAAATGCVGGSGRERARRGLVDRSQPMRP